MDWGFVMASYDRGRRILILGAGNAQIDLIKYCKKSGMEVYGCSYTDKDPGIPLLDHFEQVNITDVKGVSEYARRGNVDVVYSVGSDLAMPTVARTSEKLGLVCFSPVWAADTACDKGRMRTLLGASRWNPPYRCFRRIEELRDWTIFPATVKPVDSQGQRGVSYVESPEDLPGAVEHARTFSRCGGMIIEKYVDGPEVSVNLFMRGGKAVFLMITDRESFRELPGGIIHRHYIPSVFSGTETEKKICSLVLKIAEMLGVTDGPMYFQIKTENGNPYLIETSPRLDGCHIWRLIRMYCGVDLLKMTMDTLLRKDNMLRDHRDHRETEADDEGSGDAERIPMMLEFFCEPPGTVFLQERYASLPALYRQMYYENGQRVRPVNGYMEKCGYRIVETSR